MDDQINMGDKTLHYFLSTLNLDLKQQPNPTKKQLHETTNMKIIELKSKTATKSNQAITTWNNKYENHKAIITYTNARSVYIN